jgi:hypothetical protein
MGRRDLVLLFVVAVLVLAAFVPRGWLLEVREFDRDELEHLHAAWCVSKGLVPYRDFFEHHTPGLYFLLAPLYSLYSVETKVEHAVAFMTLARRLMWGLTGAILVLTAWLGWLWRDVRVGSVAALLLGNTLLFLKKTLEVRPDVPCAVLWLGAVVAVTFACRAHDQRAKRAGLLFGTSGLLLGSGIMFSQKLLFALPGMGVALAWLVLRRRADAGRGAKALLAVALGALLPLAATLGFFAWTGSLADFIRCNLLINANWRTSFSPAGLLLTLARDSPFLVAFGMAGFLRELTRITSGSVLLAANAAGLFLGLFLIPVPHAQYYLMLLPFAALFGAGFLVDWVEAIAVPKGSEQTGVPRGGRARALAGGLLALLCLLVFCGIRAPVPLPVSVALWGGASLLSVPLLATGRSAASLAVVLAALSVGPLFQLRQEFAWTNRNTLNQIRYVIEKTTPDQSCMDGWKGWGVFRPHAYYYYFIHSEVRAMWTDAQPAEILAGLRSGSIAPKLLFMDGHLSNVSREVTAYFEEHYRPVKGIIWRRKKPKDAPPGSETGPDSAEAER